MSKFEQPDARNERKELFRQPLNVRGYSEARIEIEPGKELYLTGQIYEVDGKRYMLPTEAGWFDENSNYHQEQIPDKYKDWPHDNDKWGVEGFVDETVKERIAGEIKKQAEADENILKARIEKVEALSGGNPLLKDVLMAHIDYMNGHIDENPTEINGIKFYRIGHNATHQFSIGTKDGKRYSYTVGESAEDPDKLDSDVEEVESWEGGYYGHH